MAPEQIATLEWLFAAGLGLLFLLVVFVVVSRRRQTKKATATSSSANIVSNGVASEESDAKQEAPGLASSPAPSPAPSPAQTPASFRQTQAEVAKETSLKEALKKTESHLWGRLKLVFASNKEFVREEIEEVLITADLGPQTTNRIIDSLEEQLKNQDWRDEAKVKVKLKQELRDILNPSAFTGMQDPDFFPFQFADSGPTVIMVVGVNGAGKTTSIGKLAAKFANHGLKVLVAAGDTFRAAASQQLKTWTERAQVEIFSPEGVKDPGAVAFDAVQKAKSQGFDMVIIDTAGRLHTQAPLMEELKKVKRVMTKVIPEAPHECWIVLDSNSGQNALNQARQFHESIGLTGVILTKLDGSAKGGVAFGISHELKLPICWIGIGEKLGDLRVFDRSEFVESLFA